MISDAIKDTLYRAMLQFFINMMMLLGLGVLLVFFLAKHITVQS